MKTILLVEDDPAVQRGIRENLKRERFRVLVERDGTQGLSRAVRESPDLVILDVMLPGLNGFEVCERLKKEGFSAPIFMLTALGDEKAKLRGLGLGADDYLPKPFSVEELLLRVRNAFDRADRTLGKAKAYELELERAREIQQESLPKRPPRMRGLDLWGAVKPSTLVGGDYFDYLRIGPGKIAIIVADVCGKGMPAALYVQRMQGIVHASMPHVESAGDILRQLQQHLGLTLGPASFITAIAGVVDQGEGTFDVACAGHPPALLKRGATIEMLKAEGMWIGPTMGRSFEELLQPVTIEYKPGDLIVFYTDGVIECMNRNEEEFGMARWQDVLLQAGGTSRALVRSTFNELRRFAGDQLQSDDITIVAITIP